MGEWEKYIARGAADREFAAACERLNIKNNLLWATVVYGYVAIFYINAALVKFKGLPKNHKERRRLIHEWPRLRELGAQYDYIFARCRQARYDPAYQPAPEEIEKVKENLAKIVAAVSNLTKYKP